MTQEQFTVELPVKGSDKAVACPIDPPTLDASNKFSKAGTRLKNLKDSRKALVEASYKIIAELAIAEVAALYAPEDKKAEVTQNVEDLRAANDAILKKLDTNDDQSIECLVNQLKAIVTVPKSAEGTQPEINWGAISAAKLGEATTFFLTGKRPSAPLPSE